MPVKAIPKLSIARNGIGAFVKSCHKVTVQFCNWGGSSKGVRELLTESSSRFRRFTTANKDTTFEIVKKSGHPTLIFHYNTGTENSVCVRNLDAKGVLQKLDEHIKRAGNKPFKYNHKVMSINESVRGVWSPFHEPKEHRHKI